MLVVGLLFVVYGVVLTLCCRRLIVGCLVIYC